MYYNLEFTAHYIGKWKPSCYESKQYGRYRWCIRYIIRYKPADTRRTRGIYGFIRGLVYIPVEAKFPDIFGTQEWTTLSISSDIKMQITGKTLQAVQRFAIRTNLVCLFNEHWLSDERGVNVIDTWITNTDFYIINFLPRDFARV